MLVFAVSHQSFPQFTTQSASCATFAIAHLALHFLELFLLLRWLRCAPKRQSIGFIGMRSAKKEYHLRLVVFRFQVFIYQFDFVAENVRAAFTVNAEGEQLEESRATDHRTH